MKQAIGVGSACCVLITIKIIIIIIIIIIDYALAWLRSGLSK